MKWTSTHPWGEAYSWNLLSTRQEGDTREIRDWTVASHLCCLCVCFGRCKGETGRILGSGAFYFRTARSVDPLTQCLPGRASLLAHACPQLVHQLLFNVYSYLSGTRCSPQTTKQQFSKMSFSSCLIWQCPQAAVRCTCVLHARRPPPNNSKYTTFQGCLFGNVSKSTPLRLR